MASNAELAQDTYADWSNEDLMSRVNQLEAQLKAQQSEIEKRKLTVRSTPSDSAPSSIGPHPKKKQKLSNNRNFDSSKYNTRFIALKFAYLGCNYSGFEFSGTANKTETIEEILWHALVKTKLIFKDENESVNWDGCEYSKCGRTDIGVSAFGQVIALRVRSNRLMPQQSVRSEDGDENAEPATLKSKVFDDINDELQYPQLLNRVLPPDVRILAWCPDPPEGFSARHSCRQRRYRYFFTQPAWFPMGKSVELAPKWSTGCDGWLDIEAMSVAAKKYEGLHDFRNFCKQNPPRQITNFERRIHRAEIVPVPIKSLGLPCTEKAAIETFAKQSPSYPQSCIYSFDVDGSAFLWHQVRHLVAVLFLVGQGFEKPEIVDTLLNIQKTPRRPTYGMASDHPLVLWDCVFPKECDDPSTDSLNWIYIGNQTPTARTGKRPDGNVEGVFGPKSITESAWENWHSKKIDETLAGELLNIIAENIPQNPTVDEEQATAQRRRPPITRLFAGESTLRGVGQYVPLLKMATVEEPEVTNARWREKNKDKAAKYSDRVAEKEAQSPRNGFKAAPDHAMEE